MKSLSVLFLLFSLNVFAATCPERINEGSLGSMYDPEEDDEISEYSNFQKISTSYHSLNKEEFLKIPVIGTEFSYEECKDAIIFLEFKDLFTGEYYTGYYTNDDSCDGGNSYGSIFNDKEEYIADIGDGDFSCKE